MLVLRTERRPHRPFQIPGVKPVSNDIVVTADAAPTRKSRPARDPTRIVALLPRLEIFCNFLEPVPRTHRPQRRLLRHALSEHQRQPTVLRHSRELYRQPRSVLLPLRSQLEITRIPNQRAPADDRDPHPAAPLDRPGLIPARPVLGTAALAAEALVRTRSLVATTCCLRAIADHLILCPALRGAIDLDSLRRLTTTYQFSTSSS